MKHRKDVYAVKFEVKATVTMEVSADTYSDAENTAWDKYENMSYSDFLADAEIDECVIDDVTFKG